MKEKTLLQIDMKVELRDRNGKLLRTMHKKGHSYVKYFIILLQAAMNASGNSSDWAVNAAVTAEYGIVVGSGSTAVTINDTVLETPIHDGSSSGHLNYGAVSVGATVIVGSSDKFTIARTFTNNSGADITVYEVGLIGYLHSYMLDHTLLTFTIASGVSGTVTYTISVTV